MNEAVVIQEKSVAAKGATALDMSRPLANKRA